MYSNFLLFLRFNPWCGVNIMSPLFQLNGLSVLKNDNSTFTYLLFSVLENRHCLKKAVSCQCNIG